MGTLDSILNVAVPVVLLLIVIGFLWVKLLSPFVVPMISKLIGNIKDKKQSISTKKEISFE